MLLPIVSLILAFISSAVHSNQAASANTNVMLKIGGGTLVASLTEFPFAVQLRIKKYGQIVQCGGSIIAPNLVLTAAHCVQPTTSFGVVMGGDNPVTVNVTAGELHFSGDGPYAQHRHVAEIVLHPEYDRSRLPNDLALLVLSQPFTLTEHVRVISLPQSGANFTGKATIAGWGDLRESEVDDSENVDLRRADVSLLDGSVCSQFYRHTSIPLPFDDLTMICAGGGPADTCKGDSGGPLVCTSESREYLCGVTSWGMGCNTTEAPGAYTRVTAFAGWIQQKMQEFSATPGGVYCGGGVHLPSTVLCNGLKECASGVDEAGCGDCEDDEFRCAATGRCVRRSYVCDHDDDCGDGSDELGCGQCPSTEFRCRNDKCVPSLCHALAYGTCFYQQCLHNEIPPLTCSDGAAPSINCTARSLRGECVLGTWNCASDCPPSQFKCAGHGRCIPASFVCDGDDDCRNGSDEADCPSREVSTPATPTETCPNRASCIWRDDALLAVGFALLLAMAALLVLVCRIAGFVRQRIGQEYLALSTVTSNTEKATETSGPFASPV